MSRKKLISTVVLTLVSLLFLYLAFSRIDLKELAASFRQVNWLWVIPFAVVTWAGFWWRAWRWVILLEPKKKLSVREAFGPLMIGFGFNSIFPARAGEFARPLALTKATGVPFTTAFSTVFIERVLDSLTLLGLFALAPLFIDFGSTVSMSYDASRTLDGGVIILVGQGLLALVALAGLGGALWWLKRPSDTPKSPAPVLAAAGVVVVLCVVAGLLVQSRFEIGRDYTFGQKVVLSPDTLPDLVAGLSRFVALLFIGSVLMMFDGFRNLVRDIILRVPLLPSGFKGKIRDLFQTFAEGFDALRDVKRATLLVLHSLGCWFLTGASFWLLSYGVPGLEMSLTTGMAFLVITCIAILIPAAPGYWGLYEVGGVLALILVGAVANDAAGSATALTYTLVAHAVQWIIPTAFGLYYAARIHVSTADVERGREELAHHAEG
jgi:uncharacterized membrane protein YbhN (UPF0104 family)